MERVVGKLDKDIQSFVDEFVASFVNWDLVSFFSSNPDTATTAADIASRLGRREKDIQAALDGLVRKGLFKRKQESGRTLYVCHPSPELKERMDLFVRSLEDRAKRLQILAYLLRKHSARSGD